MIDDLIYSGAKYKYDSSNSKISGFLNSAFSSNIKLSVIFKSNWSINHSNIVLYMA